MTKEELLMELILMVLQEVLVLAATVAIGFLIAWLRRKTNAEQLKLIESIVVDGVLFAQQVYGHLDGEKKYEQAQTRILEMLKSKNITLKEEEVKVFIESTIKRLKKEFQEQWD